MDLKIYSLSVVVKKKKKTSYKSKYEEIGSRIWE